MQSFVVLLIVFTAVVVNSAKLEGEMAEMAQMLREDCLGQTGADLALIEEINNGATVMPDPKLKCYMKCLMETVGVMSEETVLVEVVAALMPEELAKYADLLRACGTKKGVDACDTAFQTQICWQQSMKEDYMVI